MEIGWPSTGIAAFTETWRYILADNHDPAERQKQIRKLSLDPDIPHSYTNLFEISVNGSEARIAFGRGLDSDGAPAKFDHVHYMSYDTLLQIEDVIARIKQDIAAAIRNQAKH